MAQRRRAVLFSIVIPCYKSYGTLEIVIQEIRDTMSKRPDIDYEIILVNDCSPDATMELIQRLCREDSKIKGVELAKNVGQAGALMAGFSIARGDYIATAEDDGQSSVNEIWRLFEKMEEGYDIVCARNITNPPRSFIRKAGAKLNRFVLDFLLDKPAEVSPSIFFLAKRQVIQEMLKYDRPYPYIGGLILRSTSKIGNVDINRRDRISGESGYTLKKLVGLLFNGITAFSIKPLRVATFLGCISFVLGLFTALFLCINWFVNKGIVPGYTSIISVLLIMGGLILLILGIIGEYIGRIYMCLNHAPQYIIRSLLNCEETDGKGL